MSKKTDDKAELSEEELERQRAEELPDREVMTTIRPWPPLPTVEPGGLEGNLAPPNSE